jgi:hypothetical protein
MTHNGKLNANIHVSIHPPIPFMVQALPNNTEEILFEKLPTEFLVTVSYLYFPPITFNQINAQIYSDEGPARVINVLPQEQYPRWLLTILWVLVGIGVIAVLYGPLTLLR